MGLPRTRWSPSGGIQFQASSHSRQAPKAPRFGALARISRAMPSMLRMEVSASLVLMAHGKCFCVYYRQGCLAWETRSIAEYSQSGKGCIVLTPVLIRCRARKFSLHNILARHIPRTSSPLREATYREFLIMCMIVRVIEFSFRITVTTTQKRQSPIDRGHMWRGHYLVLPSIVFQPEWMYSPLLV